MDDTKTTDLGMIRVVSKGQRDMVYLAHNNLKIFSVSCSTGKESRVRQNPEFIGYSEEQRMQIFSIYDRWKRSRLPGFKLPQHSGQTRDGHTHPFRKKLYAKKQAKPGSKAGQHGDIQEFPEL